MKDKLTSNPKFQCSAATDIRNTSWNKTSSKSMCCKLKLYSCLKVQCSLINTLNQTNSFPKAYSGIIPIYNSSMTTRLCLTCQSRYHLNEHSCVCINRYLSISWGTAKGEITDNVATSGRLSAGWNWVNRKLRLTCSNLTAGSW